MLFLVCYIECKQHHNSRMENIWIRRELGDAMYLLSSNCKGKNMVITYDTWLGDEDLVRFLERHFTYKTPHYYIEYADSTNAPKSIYGRHDEQETPSQIFYSTDFDPNNEMIKFLVIKAMETVEESGEFPGVTASSIHCSYTRWWRLCVQHTCRYQACCVCKESIVCV